MGRGGGKGGGGRGGGWKGDAAGHRDAARKGAARRAAKAGVKVRPVKGPIARMKAKVAKRALKAIGKHPISPTGGRSSLPARPNAVSSPNNPHRTGSSARFRNPRR